MKSKWIQIQDKRILFIDLSNFGDNARAFEEELTQTVSTIGQEMYQKPLHSVLVLVDLTATPEPEAQGRFLAALRAAAPDLPLALLADETAWQRRFAAWPERGEQRRAAWHALARAHDVPFLGLALEADDSEAARHALESLLNRVA